jgi:uncharacterized protein YbaR (Trm112 family)
MNPPFPPELMEILACPACAERPPLRWQEDALACDQCRRAYPVREGIPVLLVEEAISLEPSPAPPTEPVRDPDL